MHKLFMLSMITISVSCQESVTSARIYFFHGYRFGRNTEHILEESANIVRHPNFDRNKPTVLYIHGFTESAGSVSAWTVVNAYIERNDHNILLLDWSKYSDGRYFVDAIPGMQELAPYASHSLILMFDAGLDISKFHMVGHSLGGQLAGLIGRTVYKLSKQQYKINRISALDIAKPGFYPAILFLPLQPTDANFIDAIHTDAGVFGATVSVGNVDFWPNGGTPIQPGCNLPQGIAIRFCSHHRAWVYWAESLQNQYYAKFHAVKANSWFDFISGISNGNDVGYMGISANAGMFGNYFLQTNAESPFSRGEEGLHYQIW